MPSTVGGPEVNGPPASWLKLPHGAKTVTHARWYQDDNEYVKLTAPDLPADASNWSWYLLRSILVQQRLKLRLQVQLENRKNGFETRRGSNFRPFWLESSRFIPQRRETGRPIPI